MTKYALIDVAYHEAAHALVCDHEGLDLVSLTVADPTGGGRCYYQYDPDDPRSYEHRARTDLAGSVADWLRRPARGAIEISERDFTDVIEIRDEAGWFYGHINVIANETLTILRNYWTRVEVLAEALLAAGAMSGERAIAVMNGSVDWNDPASVDVGVSYRLARARNSILETPLELKVAA